jgi:hypothetical protein
MIGSFVASSNGAGIFFEGVVKEMPYCADTEDVTVKTLANGNHIRREDKGRECRDSQGRTYFQREMGTGLSQFQKIQTISIIDPVGGRFIHLNPIMKSANVAVMPTAARPQLPLPQRREMVAPRKLDPSMMPVRSTENLGEKEIEGVLAHGDRTTTTYPAGSRGNDEPLKESSERWVAKDLRIVVMTIHDSDENGVTTHKIKNLQRAEPDPATFEVPPDYTVDKN